ncbi:MAG: WD40 repeat domain-containing protein [Clostridia bacterium]|nr:WD40 repeat domain-containing protein [Clostridia bacterium]
MKKLFSVLLLICLCLSFVACGGDATEQPDSNVTGSQSEVVSSESSADTSTDTSTDSSFDSAASSEASTDTSVGTDTETTTDTKVESSDPVPNLVLAGDQRNNEVIVYDLDKLEAGDDLDLAEEWSYNAGVSHIAGMKYREDTVFGDVIIIAAGANNGKAQMVSYPEGKLLWSTDKAGNNPHCIEILPSGNIIVASSTGGTLRFFKTSALLNNDTATASTYTDYALYGAHGVLWDPKFETLWGLGDDALTAYSVSGEGVDEVLTPNIKKSVALPADGGHALAADMTDPNYLYVSVGSGIYRFAKEKRSFTSFLHLSSVKGIAHISNGNFAISVPNGTYKSWCTDVLQFYTLEGRKYKPQSFKSADGCAFYKVYAFDGQYQ